MLLIVCSEATFVREHIVQFFLWLIVVIIEHEEKEKAVQQGEKITAAQSRAIPVPQNTSSGELVYMHSPCAPSSSLAPEDTSTRTTTTTTTDTGRTMRRCNNTTTRRTCRSRVCDGGVVLYAGSAVIGSASRRLPGVGRGHRRGNGRNQIPGHTAAVRRTRIHVPVGTPPAVDAGRRDDADKFAGCVCSRGEGGT